MALKKTSINNKLNEIYDFKTMSDSEKLLDDIKKIVSITKGTYPLDPELGLDIHKDIYEPKDSMTLETVKKKVESALRKYITIPIDLRVDAKYVDSDGINTILFQIDVKYRGDDLLVLGNISDSYFSVLGYINEEEA